MSLMYANISEAWNVSPKNPPPTLPPLNPKNAPPLETSDKEIAKYVSQNSAVMAEAVRLKNSAGVSAPVGPPQLQAASATSQPLAAPYVQPILATRTASASPAPTMTPSAPKLEAFVADAALEIMYFAGVGIMSLVFLDWMLRRHRGA